MGLFAARSDGAAMTASQLQPTQTALVTEAEQDIRAQLAQLLARYGDALPGVSKHATLRYD